MWCLIYKNSSININVLFVFNFGERTWQSGNRRAFRLNHSQIHPPPATYFNWAQTQTLPSLCVMEVLGELWSTGELIYGNTQHSAWFTVSSTNSFVFLKQCTLLHQNSTNVILLIPKKFYSLEDTALFQKDISLSILRAFIYVKRRPICGGEERQVLREQNLIVLFILFCHFIEYIRRIRISLRIKTNFSLKRKQTQNG